MAFVVLRLLYLIALLACSGYVLLRGGRDERTGLGILILASVLTVPAIWLKMWLGRVNVGVLTIDIAALAACLWLMLRSTRFWPIWMTAFQIAPVLLHLLQIARPHILEHVYAEVEGFWAYLWMAALIIGTKCRSRSLPKH